MTDAKFLGLTANQLAKEASRLRAENAELREERNHWHVEQVHAYGNWEDAYKRASELESENAKLRELLTFYLGCLTKGHVNCDSCAFKDDVCGHGRKVIDGARELGIEVPDGNGTG